MVELYMMDGCPYCQKVLRAVKDLGIVENRDFKIIDAAPHTPGNQTVVKIGGEGMVPFLVDGSISMYESLDIIDYLKQKFQD